MDTLLSSFFCSSSVTLTLAAYLLELGLGFPCLCAPTLWKARKLWPARTSKVEMNPWPWLRTRSSKSQTIRALTGISPESSSRRTLHRARMGSTSKKRRISAGLTVPSFKTLECGLKCKLKVRVFLSFLSACRSITVPYALSKRIQVNPVVHWKMFSLCEDTLL